MTSPPHTTAMEAFPMPEGAIQLPPQSPQRSEQEAVIQALQRAPKERQLTLPLGLKPRSTRNNGCYPSINSPSNW